MELTACSLSSGLASGIVSAVVVFAIVLAAFLLYRRRRSRSQGLVRIGSGGLENGLSDFDIDGPSSSFAKFTPDKAPSKPTPPASSSLRQSFAANIRHRISSWYSSRRRNSSAFYITAWNPRAAVHVVRLPAVSESAMAYESSERRSHRDPERSHRRRHRKKRKREQRERELQLQRAAEHMNLQLGSVAGASDEGNRSSSSSRHRRKKRRERRERERDADNSSSGRESGRMRRFRNSRIVRATRNLHFAKPGSSTNGSTYAPTMSGLTSEISERPTMTLSPISEV